MIFDIIKCIQSTDIKQKYEIGDTITINILDTGADLTVTGKNDLHKKG